MDMSQNISTVIINPGFVELLEKLAALTPEEIAERFASEYEEQFTPGVDPRTSNR